MSDKVPDTKPPTKWLWLGAIVLLAVATVIFVLNADGDEDLETIPDHAITTDEERMNTDLPVTEDMSGMLDGTGADDAAANESTTIADEAEPVTTE